MIDLIVPAMSCGHCVATVQQAVKRVDAAASVQVDLAAKRVSIESATPAEAFRRALTEEGYAPA